MTAVLCVNLIYNFFLEISQWFKAPKKGPYRPDGRRSLVSVAVGDSVLYFGGYNATKKTHYGDLFMLNTSQFFPFFFFSFPPFFPDYFTHLLVSK